MSRTFKIYILLLLILLPASPAAASAAPLLTPQAATASGSDTAADTIFIRETWVERPDGEKILPIPPDVYRYSASELARDTTRSTDRNWWTLFRRGQLSMTDTTVEWPRFLKFCVDVYNWGDRTFNSYDTAYVVGTGRRWKARLTNDNWADSYAMNIDRKMSMRMMGDIYCSLGAYLQYMAVSVGYAVDMSHIIGNKPINHKKFEFGFNCARFNIEAYYHENTGGTYMRKFGNYDNGHLFKMAFPGLTLYKYGFNGVFFFNNRRYSQGAAYNFSKFQKISCGSWMIGASYTNLDVNLDMRKLDARLLPYLRVDALHYRFHYDSYCLQGGYGYNWVINPHLLYNITVMPGIGLTHCYEDSLEGTGSMTALAIRGMTSLTYNLRDFFVCLNAKIDGNWYKSDRYSFFSSIENLSANVGIRF